MYLVFLSHLCTIFLYFAAIGGGAFAKVVVEDVSIQSNNGILTAHACCARNVSVRKIYSVLFKKQKVFYNTYNYLHHFKIQQSLHLYKQNVVFIFEQSPR